MAIGHLLAAPDRIVSNFEPILEKHGITCEVESVKEFPHRRYVIDYTSLICRDGRTQVEVGIEKRRGRRGVDIILMPEVRTFFRRDYDSEALAERIVKILCESGASNQPDARGENLE